MRTLTERIAKRIRKGQPIPKTSIPNETLLRWATQYARTRKYATAGVGVAWILGDA